MRHVPLPKRTKPGIVSSPMAEALSLLRTPSNTAFRRAKRHSGEKFIPLLFFINSTALVSSGSSTGRCSMASRPTTPQLFTRWLMLYLDQWASMLIIALTISVRHCSALGICPSNGRGLNLTGNVLRSMVGAFHTNAGAGYGSSYGCLNFDRLADHFDRITFEITCKKPTSMRQATVILLQTTPCRVVDRFTRRCDI